MTSAYQLPQHTREDYFAVEARHPDTRYEYDQGVVYAMAGAEEDHRTIAGNIYGSFFNQAKGTPCFVWQSDTRVAPSKGTSYYYPDVVAVCGERLYEIVKDMKSLINPSLVVEVHSSSTEMFDRTRKREIYRRMPAVMDYLMVRQNIVHILHDSRTAEGWVTQEFWALSDELVLAGLGWRLKVSDVYDKIEGLPEA